MTRINKACYERGCACYDDRVDDDAVEVILAQQEQEPHGWYIDGYGAVIGTAEPKSVRVGEWLPWYTVPPQRKPLTDEEIYDMYNEPRSDAEMIAFARAIEAKIKENT
jgi:hypothetical protein